MIPHSVRKEEQNAMDVQDLTTHEELCRELEEEHDREEEMAGRDFTGDIYGQLND